ncbi:M15 family metallopeptidase [Leisingera sp. HS039]|uniref:M15 family metallopeptidase n=1 Tax=Leisingera sp. HS039 TaxID=2818496 RepID=UPI001B39DE83|nr:M15 family metallopeptidase [Leisingera sp. HS039]MBQ4826539.1 M15 family metallopeptidase [Leisingera sp. HS039]
MQVSDIQMLLADAGWYEGAIDGDAGPKTWAAVASAWRNADRVAVRSGGPWPEDWTHSRRLVAAGQIALHQMGYGPGVIDGYAGRNTEEALTDWRSEKVGVSSLVERSLVSGGRNHPSQKLFPHQRDMAHFYGDAGGAQCTAGKVDLAYPMLIAWNKPQTVRRFSCHEKVAQPLTGIFQQTLQHYGLSDVERLGLNIFGGCFNFRRMRGGTSLSTHAYGAAVDLNPEQNQLRWGADRAQFAQPEYVPFWNIVMAHGGTPAGYAWGKDWMHFQFAGV